MKTKKHTSVAKQMASELRKKAKKVFLYDLKEYTKHIKKDYKDLCTIATQISDGKFDKAWKKIGNLDTTTRQDIPNKVYDYVSNKVSN